jgi:hypothetical protein
LDLQQGGVTMQAMLVILAVLIFILYSIYFIKIIKGSQQSFELEILRSLADWIIVKGASTKTYIWTIFWGDLLGELLYFILTLMRIQNPVIMSLTAFIIVIEIYHFFSIAVGLRRFFAGKYLLSQIFRWRVERTSAILLFTHSLLVLIILTIY